jgi:hypothetical protein
MKKQEYKSKKLLNWVSPLFVILCCAVGIQAHAENIDKKAKDFIEKSSDDLKKDIDKLGDNFEEIQNYLKNYSWKGLIQDQASSGAETLSQLKLNHQGKAIVVRPGETIQGEVVCSLNSEKAHNLNVYRVVIGLYKEGPQTTIGTALGIRGGSSKEEFSLTAPMKPGIYQIRFRTADNFLESKALDAWVDKKGNEPDASTTIGIIYVKS